MIFNRFTITCTTQTAETETIKLLNAESSEIIKSSRHTFGNTILDVAVDYSLASVKTMMTAIGRLDNTTVASNGNITVHTDQERAQHRDTIRRPIIARRNALETANQTTHKPILIQAIKQYSHQKHDDAKLQSMSHAELENHHVRTRREYQLATKHLNDRNEKINKNKINQTLKRIDRSELESLHHRHVNVL